MDIERRIGPDLSAIVSEVLNPKPENSNNNSRTAIVRYTSLKGEQTARLVLADNMQVEKGSRIMVTPVAIHLSTAGRIVDCVSSQDQT